ncbi:DUF4336 domain-containing protein, partial [Methylomonas koyamae]|uniref:DUF4336 domain-containing protein n=1 Tax=Methylomonas koyamae TaxID=702114 RepID=UPI0021B1B63D
MTTRSTFVRLANGEVWVHSPILPAPELIGAIAEIGPVKHVIAPNKSHHLFFLPFLQACRDAQGYIAPGLAEKRPDLAGFPIIPSAEGATWAAELDSLFIEGLPVINETVWLHKQSGTLILTDLLFCFGKDHALLARLAARLLGVYGRLGMSRSMKLLIKDRTGLYRCAQRILDWDDGMDSSPPHAVSYCAREFKRSDEESEMNSNVVGLDTAKSIFHLYSQAANDRPVKKKLRRAEMLSYFANLPVSLIGLEACGGA